MVDSKKTQNTRAVMESEYDVKDIIVIDNGADTIKIGISGEDYPRIIIPSVAGIPDIKGDQEGAQQKLDPLYGEKLKQFRDEKKQKGQDITISERRFISEGRIECDNDVISDYMQKLWEYALRECLTVSDTQACNLLIIDSPHNDKDYKHKIADILFDELKVNSILFMNSATLSLFSTGITSGLVVESGHSLTSVVPVFEGFVIPHAIQKSSIAGEEITKQLEKELAEKGWNNLDPEIVKNIKETMCYVSKDYYIDLNGPDLFNIEDKSYELPDGQVIEFGNKERYTPCEILFNPSIIGDKTSLSISDMILDSLQRCDQDLKQELYSNIVLCGGSSLFQGMLPRIEKDLLYKLSNSIQRKDLNFVQNTHKRYSAWIGGSMLGSLSTFQSLAITKSEYEENADSSQKIQLVHKKTF